MNTTDKNIRVIRAIMLLTCLCYGGLALMAFSQKKIMIGIFLMSLVVVTAMVQRKVIKTHF